MEGTKTKKIAGGAVAACLKATLISVSVSLILILIFAIVIKFLSVPDDVIKPVNQVIKAVSLFFGCVIAFKHSKKKGLIKGLFVGLLYTVASYLIFSLLSQTFKLDISILPDLVFGSVMGAICGILTANLGKA